MRALIISVNIIDKPEEPNSLPLMGMAQSQLNVEDLDRAELLAVAGLRAQGLVAGALNIISTNRQAVTDAYQAQLKDLGIGAEEVTDGDTAEPATAPAAEGEAETQEADAGTDTKLQA